MSPVNHKPFFILVSFLACAALVLSACAPIDDPGSGLVLAAQATLTPTTILETTALPTRPAYQPAELVEYTAQTGDTLPALAVHFNTSIEEIRAANPILPSEVSTLPEGLPMQIPIYGLPLWGSSYQILPDSLFIDGPAQVDFDTQAFIDTQSGWLNLYRGPLGKDTRGAAEIIDRVALNYSISPRLLLALLEFQAGALTQAEPPLGMDPFYLGYRDSGHRSLYMQLVWAANTLNNLYYSYRAGTLTSFTHADGALERPDPWQNAATVALQVYFSTVLPVDDYAQATTGNGLALTYSYLFGDPWANQSGHIPGSLVQPALRLPFEAGKTWAYTGGPHTGYGSGQPLAAIDFAPPSVEGGCVESGEWVTAVADGVVARSEDGVLVLDLDGDADERTGWTIFYLHLLHDPSFTPGTAITAGQPLGHPSCEAGLSTGTHVHIARKYNGEWILAGGIGGVLAFNLDGWQAVAGSAEYVGTLVKTGQVVTACTCSDGSSHIQASFSP